MGNYLTEQDGEGGDAFARQSFMGQVSASAGKPSPALLPCCNLSWYCYPPQPHLSLFGIPHFCWGALSNELTDMLDVYNWEGGQTPCVGSETDRWCLQRHRRGLHGRPAARQSSLRLSLLASPWLCKS